MRAPVESGALFVFVGAGPAEGVTNEAPAAPLPAGPGADDWGGSRRSAADALRVKIRPVTG